MVNTVLISIVIPTRNRSSRLNGLLCSLKAYGYFDSDDCEIIVVENAPEAFEQTRRLVESYRVSYVQETKPGRSAALNRGIKVANGKYLIFLDDDTQLDNYYWLDYLLKNFEDDRVGYVSGNVVAFTIDAESQRIWEKKGGLSKGNSRQEYCHSWFVAPRLFGVPIRKVAAGANCAIPKNVLTDVGLYDEMLGPGAVIPHGESLDICYRIMYAGYSAVYEPRAIVKHHHPESLNELSEKLFIYGLGDTAVHMKFFWEYNDSRSFLEAIAGRNLLWFTRLVLSLLGRYPLYPRLIIVSMWGAFLGPLRYLRYRLTRHAYQS